MHVLSIHIPACSWDIVHIFTAQATWALTTLQNGDPFSNLVFSPHCIAKPAYRRRGSRGLFQSVHAVQRLDLHLKGAVSIKWCVVWQRSQLIFLQSLVNASFSVFFPDNCFIQCWFLIMRNEQGVAREASAQATQLHNKNILSFS